MEVTTIATICSVIMIILGIGTRIFLKKIDTKEKEFNKDGNK